MRLGKPSRTDEKAEVRANDLRTLLEKDLRERLITPMETKLPQTVKGRTSGSDGCGCLLKRA
ncbi:hypothetical protein CCP1ISM_4710001 [Azospirillaceae bacterium]